MSASWQELRWSLHRSQLDAAVDVLFSLGCLGTQEDFLPGQAPPPRQPWETGPRPPLPPHVLLRAWWPASDDTCHAQVSAAAQQLGGEISWGSVSDRDWADSWKAHFRRQTYGAELAISPPWDCVDGDVIIEPGMAFGSGDHPTTKACLQGIVRHAQPGERCLDVGCGSGILALAAARLGMVVVGIDIDPTAVEVARENAQINGLSATFSDTDLADVTGTFPLVVANVYAEVLTTMAGDLARLCSGVLVLAGILSARSHMIEDALVDEGWQVVRRQLDGEWTSLELQKL